MLLLALIYVASPLDLIPDWLPLLGQLDDLALLLLAGSLAVRLVPPAVWQECLQQVGQPWPAPRSAARGTRVSASWIPGRRRRVRAPAP